MPITVICDWCGQEIGNSRYVKLEASGLVANGRERRVDHFQTEFIYHATWHYDDEEDNPTSYGGFYQDSCIGSALKALNGDKRFTTPDAGYAWVLVPQSERFNAYQRGTYTEAVLGQTPLADLELDGLTYKAVTERGIFTVEQAADARRRGNIGVGPKRLANLDAALVRRGLLGEGIA